MIGEICLSLYALYCCTFCCMVIRDLIRERNPNTQISYNNSINQNYEAIDYPNFISRNNIRISKIFSEIFIVNITFFKYINFLVFM